MHTAEVRMSRLHGEISTSQLLCRTILYDDSERLMTGWESHHGGLYTRLRSHNVVPLVTRTTHTRQAGNTGSCAMNNIQQPLSRDVTIKGTPKHMLLCGYREEMCRQLWIVTLRTPYKFSRPHSTGHLPR